jgi:hypothetical protein
MHENNDLDYKVLNNKQHLDTYYNFDRQMSISKW